MISFSMSPSYRVIGFLPFLAGIMKSNVGAMALMPVIRATGATIGPMIGGLVANPYETRPNTFGKYEYRITYPYALPCLVIAFFCIFSWA
ncbi:unnamed protein product [Mycena citricolor]|uniref:Major facilitator superfamily (MFS) profile domain-containing protein n=1 Tax=Mycena citricolor TaxID=2018698 RepID=A0AAD2HLV9_9AGAR|nr:unnamed protein product [Mycena citricolor]